MSLAESMEGASAPDVSIVLICYNDAGRLPRALESLRKQTLRSIEIIIVDDASTDDTERVALQAVRVDPRVRYVRLDENSGGCSAPRNRGIEEAQGTWIMFCDSDDCYERHAAKNLLLAVEAADADLGCGVAERIDMRTGQARRWRESLHEAAVLASIEDRLELIADTISVNKIYRRSFLLDQALRFPEGLLYEDQLFTMQAYCQATRIAVIPQTTYLWSVDRVGDEPSITQRRREERNARDRVTINARIDAYLADRGSEALRRAKARKFLSHDLYLYLSSILESDDSTASALIDIWEPYVRTTELKEAASLRPALRVAVYHLLLRDLEGIRSAMRCIRWSAVVEVPVIARSGRQVWACEHLDAGPDVAGLDPSWWLDMSAMAIADAPVPDRRLCHRLSEFQVAGKRVQALGLTADPFGMLVEASRVRLAVSTAAGRVWCSVPVTVHSGSPIRWEAEAAWQWQVDPVVESHARGSLALVVEVDGQVNQMPLRKLASEVERQELDLGHGVLVSLGPGEHGSIDWRVLRPGRGWRAWRQGRGTVPGLLRVLHRRALWVTSAIASRLPPRSVVVFESSAGRAFDGHPRAISEALASDPVRQAWSYASEPERFPVWAEAVRRDTLRHRWVLSRARWWVDDSGYWQAIRKHSRNRMLQTWRGQPVAKLGSEGLDAPLAPRSQRWPAPSQVRRWDLMLAPSPTFADHVPAAVGFRGDLIEGTTPFGDAVQAAASEGDRRSLAKRLALPEGRPIIMAVTAGTELPFDLAEVVAELGDRSFWLLARDDGARLALPAACRAAARDVSTVDGRAAHLAAADLLVTDASIWTLEFARLRRPMIVWGPTFAHLLRTAGVLVDLPALLPTVDSTTDLIASLRQWLDRSTMQPESWSPSSAGLDVLAEMAGRADGRGAERCIRALQTGRTKDRGQSVGRG